MPGRQQSAGRYAGFEFAEQAVSIDFDGSTERIVNSASNFLHIANSWSLGIWWESDDISGSPSKALFTTAPNANLIRILDASAVLQDPLQITLRDSSGTIFKNYLYNASSIGLATGVWGLTVLTWDGTTLKLYHQGVERAPDNAVTDLAGTMTDPGNRLLAVGGLTTAANFLNGRVHSVGLWNSVLTADEVTHLYNAGDGSNVNWRRNVGNYHSAANLVHWWRLGFDSTNIGKDYGTAAGIDINKNSVDISSADIVSDAP